jgi:hypothetical protein
MHGQQETLLDHLPDVHKFAFGAISLMLAGCGMLGSHNN